MIDDYWWLLMIIDNFWWLLMIIDDYWWLLIIFSDYWWLLINFDDYWWFLIIFDDYWWLLMIIDDYWFLEGFIAKNWTVFWCGQKSPRFSHLSLVSSFLAHRSDIHISVLTLRVWILSCARFHKPCGHCILWTIGWLHLCQNFGPGTFESFWHRNWMGNCMKLT